MTTVVVMGASGRIGRVLTGHLLKTDTRVIALDIEMSILFDYLGEDLTKHENLLAVKVDLYDVERLDEALQEGVKIYGQLDAAVYTAYPMSRGFGESFENLVRENLFQDVQHQLGAPILFAQRICNLFKKQQYGNLVFISSIQGVSSPKFDHYEGLDLSSPIEYSVGKASLISATRYLAKYLGPMGIRVNSISPGGLLDDQPIEFRERYRKDTLMKGLLDPEDLLGAIDFLVSDSSKFITGQNLIVDDGWSL